MIKIGFELETDEGVEAPSSSVIAQGLREALPKEWWADHRDDDWGVIALFPLDHDGRPLALDARLRAEDPVQRIRRLTAELAQEKKLTAHLDEDLEELKISVEAQVVALELELAGRAGTITGQKTRIQNLTEKNDSQYRIIGDYGQQVEGLIESNSELQSKYDASLHDWTVVVKERNAADEELGDTQEEMKAVERQTEDAISRADRNYASLLLWERKYDDANALNKDLVTERDGLMDTVRNDTATVERLRGDLLACQSSNRNHMGESKVTEEMVAKIVDAMQGAGFDISGWGNDADLEELESAATVIEDELQAARKSLTDTILMIGDVADKGNDIDISLDTVSSEVDILSVKLDEIRTQR